MSSRPKLVVDFHTRGAMFAVWGPSATKTRLAKSLVAEFKQSIVFTPNVKGFEGVESLDCNVVDCSFNCVDLDGLLFDEEVPTLVIVDHYYPEYMTTWLTEIKNEACINVTFMLLTHDLSDLPSDLLKLVNKCRLGEDQSLVDAEPQTIEVDVVAHRISLLSDDAYRESVCEYFHRRATSKQVEQASKQASKQASQVKHVNQAIKPKQAEASKPKQASKQARKQASKKVESSTQK